MRGSIRAAVGIAILGAMLVPTDASAQLHANDNPTKRGPLVRDGGRCDRDRARTAGGSLVATSKSCSDVYSFNPTREDKNRRNYGAVWLQGSVDTEPGWCSRHVVMEVHVPRGVRIEDRTPGFTQVNDPERVRARLVVDADGTADPNGVIKNHFRLYPNRIKPNVDRREMTLDWRGDTGHTLGFAMGVEISWNANDGFPNRSPRGSLATSLQHC
jgi:hypothetical protein